MKILITGAGGFIGKYLTNNLAEHEIHAFTKQELNLVDIDSVRNHFASNKYDAIINCAAAGRNTPMAEDSSIISSNLASVMNLLTYNDSFSTLINIGTGAEFDVTQEINNASELDIFNRFPQHSYGLSKNIISRYFTTQPNCITLRLFGCFDDSEDDRRLLKKLHSTVSSGNEFTIQDKLFDIISAWDFSQIVRAVLNKSITEQDINCVYAKKYRLSEILSVYCDKHNLDSSLIKVSGTGLNYTGNGDILSKYNLNLQGLEQALTNYET